MYRKKTVLIPSKQLENAINVINKSMNYAGVKYWLCFGGLWGLIMNDGSIPDGDLDICVRYGEDYTRIKRAFESNPGQYSMSHAMLSDTEGHALHCGFNSARGLPHICVSFWYPWKDLLFYGHDDAHEVNGVGIPEHGYHFKGMPAETVETTRMVEWPGIVQSAKICVPRFPGLVLDNLYPDWAYRKQKYMINKRNEVDKSRMVSYHQGGAISKYVVRVGSMGDFTNERLISQQLVKSEQKFNVLLKTRV